MLMQRVMDCSSEKGALNWLAVLPLDELGFSLHEGAYRDALCLHFGWQPPHMPSNCVCCKRQTVEHALNCSHGGFPALRKTSQPDVFLKCATDVAVESELQSLTAIVNWGGTAPENSQLRRRCTA